jgi:hypothetical protein
LNTNLIVFIRVYMCRGSGGAERMPSLLLCCSA